MNAVVAVQEPGWLITWDNRRFLFGFPRQKQAAIDCEAVEGCGSRLVPLKTVVIELSSNRNKKLTRK